MANLTKDQVNTILKNAPAGSDKMEILDGLVKRGHNLEGVNMQQAKLRVGTIETRKRMQGNQVDDAPDERSFLGKARDFTTGIIGGGKLAEGAGQALANSDSFFAKGVRGLQSAVTGGGWDTTSAQESVAKSVAQAQQQELKLVNRIIEKKNAGEDTASLEYALGVLRNSIAETTDFQQDTTDALVTDKEVIGSALRLAGTMASVAIGKGATSVAGGTGTGLVKGAVQGAKIGAMSGAVEGGIHGAGLGLEQNMGAKGVAGSAVGGATVGGVTGGVLGGVVGGVTGKLQAKAIRKQELKELLEANPNNKVLQAKAGLEKNNLAKEALKQGFDEDNVAFVTTMDDADKVKANKMLDVVKKRMNDPRAKILDRPNDIVGDSVLERWKALKKINKQAINELDDVAQQLKGQTVNTEGALTSFIDDMDDLGVTFKNGKPVFSGSQVEGITPAESLIKRVVKRANNVDPTDAYEVHKLKKFLYEQMDYTKSSEGYKGAVEGVMKRFAHNIDESLDTTFDAYNRTNTKFSTTRGVLDVFDDITGSKFNPTAPSANKELGTLLRRVDSNTRSRYKILDMLNDMQEVAGQYGTKFDDDVIAQTVFANDLEDVFQTYGKHTFRGESADAIQKGKGWISRMRRSQGLGDLALETGADVLEHQKNQDNALKAMRALLNGSDNVTTKVPVTSVTNKATKVATKGGSMFDKADDIMAETDKLLKANPTMASVPKQAFKNAHPEDVKEIMQFIDTVRLDRKALTPQQTNTALVLAERFGINPNQSEGRLANAFAQLLDKNPHLLKK